MRAVTAATIALATARAIRVLTHDQIGERFVQDPVAAAVVTLPPGRRRDIAEFAADGLGCPWCIGFWLGAGALAAEYVTRDGRARGLRPAATITARALALGYITGHLATVGEAADH